MKIFRTVAAAGLLALTLSLTGCWDYVEVETVNYIMGAGIDYTSDRDIHMTIESMKVVGAGQQSQLVPLVTTTTGPTLFETSRSFSNILGQRLFWAHAFALVLSEEVARQGALDILEYVYRDVGVRGSLWLFVVRGASPEEVFRTDPLLVSSVGQHLNGLMDSVDRDPVFVPIMISEFGSTLAESGISGVVPTLRIIEQEDKKVVLPEGTAVFQADQMVGWLDGSESKMLYLLLQGEISGPLVVLVDIHGEQGEISFELRQSSVKMKPEVKGEQVTMQIEVTCDVVLTELRTLKLDFIKPEVKQALEESVTAKMESELRKLISKVQQEMRADIFGFGQIIKRSHPDIWRKNAEQWPQVFSDLPVSVTVDASLVGSGVASKILPVRE